MRSTTPATTRRLTRVASAAAAAAVAATTWLVAAPAPTATAAQHPGDFTGYALDTCDTPSQRAMTAWHHHSRYKGIGVYIAGMNRACSSQPHLTRGWVRTQSHRGWRLLPLVVGRQASCSPAGYYRGKRISPRAAGDYARARAQGAASAKGGVTAARRLGIGRGSVIWYDLEHFDLSNTRCRASAMAFTSAWTRQLHRQHYRSGFYSSASSGIRMVDAARGRRDRTVPDYLWIAEWNGSDSLGSAYISRRGWWPHRRVHQYRGGHNERHGGVTLNIDSNWMSSGRGTRPGRARPHCGVPVDFRVYDRVSRGDAGPRVAAAQCFLKQRGHLGTRTKKGRWEPGTVSGRFGRGTEKAVRRFQRAAGLKATGAMGAPTWTALLLRGSGGRAKVLKVGSGGDAVRRVQRALNAATNARIPVDGTFGKREVDAVRQYQKRTHRSRTGVVSTATWKALRAGRVARGWVRARSHGSHVTVPPSWLPTPYSSGAASPGNRPRNR